jgi:hypothetical protein
MNKTTFKDNIENNLVCIAISLFFAVLFKILNSKWILIPNLGIIFFSMLTILEVIVFWYSRSVNK